MDRVRALRGVTGAMTTTGGDHGGDQAPAVPSPSAEEGPARVDLRDAPVVTREMINAFIEESSDLVDQVEQQLLSAETAPIRHETVDEIFRSIHTIKGNAGFFWFTRVEQRCMTMEGALDEFRTEGASLDSDAAAAFIDMLDTVRASIRSVAEAAESTDADRLAEERNSVDAERQDSPDALGEILVEMGEISEDSLERALSSQQRRLGEILVSEEHVKPDSVQRALEEQAKRRSDTPTGTTEYSSARKDIRVDTTKLDKLFDLVGELITAESMVLGGIGANGSNGSDHSGNGNASIAKAASYLQKITREMQEITLSIRMIPLEATFGKMRRLVRDLARRFEKNVTIEISGEQTEMDKNVIEEVSDPLVHIIRNAIDHGIESASDREAAGKPKTGTIRLSAKHEGNEIWITIEDDGKGLDRDRILAKAVERGLVQDPDAELSDEQIYRFIFEPAFSTADMVSEISGRGVGMDVVRQNIEKLRGKIDLRSERGVGTTFVLRIPLTLAILDGVTFDIGGTHYSVPTTDLVTFQSYDPQGISRTSASHHGFRLRDEVIPIIQYEQRESVPEHGVVIVLQSNGRRAAIVVDRIVGYRQFVVRAMPGYIQSMRAVSGCSIQGDGSISFIIDVGDLMEQELESVGSR
ncbi:MAG: chemotaxis protein CheA [Spirochaetota bacterium]